MTALDRDFQRALDSLNLENIVLALTENEDGPKWSVEKAEATEAWYRRFLFLAYKYPRQDLIPSKDIDVFWHSHILHTQKYSDDCGSLFGGYLHHSPTSSREESSLANEDGCLSKTEALFVEHFGESPFIPRTSYAHKNFGLAAPCSKCGSRCGRYTNPLSGNM